MKVNLGSFEVELSAFGLANEEKAFQAKTSAPSFFLTEKSCDDDVQVRESDGEKGEEAEKVKMYSEVNLLVLVQ